MRWRRRWRPAPTSSAAAPTGAAMAHVLDVAAAAGRPVDLHMDETLDPGVLHLAALAALVIDTGFPHGVTASHCCSLGMQPPEVQADVSDAVAAAGIAVVTLPQTNLYLQARGWTTAPPRGLTAVHPLLAAGVTVAAGADNLQDPFNLVGRGDLTEEPWFASGPGRAGRSRPGTAAASHRGRPSSAPTTGPPAAGTSPSGGRTGAARPR